MPKKQIREDWCSQCIIDIDGWDSQICQESDPRPWLPWYVPGHPEYKAERNGSWGGGCNLNAFNDPRRTYDMVYYGCEDNCDEEVPCDDVAAIQSNTDPNSANFNKLLEMLEDGHKNTGGDGVCFGNGERNCTVDQVEADGVPDSHIGQNTNGATNCQNNPRIFQDSDFGTSRPRATYGGPGTSFEAALAAGHIPLSYSDCCYLIHDMMYSMIPLTSVSGGDTNAAWAVIHADQVLLQNLKYVRDVLGEEGNSDAAQTGFCFSSDWDMSVSNEGACCWPQCSWGLSDCEGVVAREADEFRRSAAHSLSETFGEALSSSDLSSVAAFIGIADTGLVGQLYIGTPTEQIGKLERSLKVVKALKKAAEVGRPIIVNFGFLELGISGVSNSWSLFENDSGSSCNNDPRGYEANGYCSAWAAYGFCSSSSRYSQWMQNNCSCSCGTGGSSPIADFDANNSEFYAEDFIGESATTTTKRNFLNNMRSIMSTYDSIFPYTPSSAPNGPWPTITTGC